MLITDQIYDKLSIMSIDLIAERNGFIIRRGGKLSPLNFVLSFFLSIQSDRHNFGTGAEQLGLLLKQSFSYNAIKKAQTKKRAKFAKELLLEAIESQAAKLKKTKLKTHLLSCFNQVYIEDSTCINLPGYLHKFFPGAHSNTGKAATAKIQLRQELKSGAYTRIELQNFRNNDQSFSSDILETLTKGDLVIRDLGYSVLPVFKAIVEQKAFFISRLRYGTNLYVPQTGELFNLGKRLRKATRNGETSVELNLVVGKKAQLPLRVCAIKCPPGVARKRRAKAKKDRSARANHSKDYIELLGWTIFITNVEKQVLTAPQILEVYGYRWRIEIIFKCWKSHLKLDQLFNTQTKLKKHQVQIAFYLFLVWVTLFFSQMYNHFLKKVFLKKKKVLSILKFAKFVKEHFTELLLNPDFDSIVEHLAYYCSYKKQNDQLNFCEIVFTRF